LVGGGTDAALNWLTTVEVYDPISGTWSGTGSLAAARGFETATLLPSGKVLFAGGTANGTYLSSAELYDIGDDPQAAWIPTLGPLLNTAAGGNASLSGTLFTGLSEASSGTFQSSAANFPLLRLERDGSEQAAFAYVTGWTASSATAAFPAGLQAGWHWATVIVNGIRGAAAPVLVSCPGSGCSQGVSDGGKSTGDAGRSDSGASDSGSPPTVDGGAPGDGGPPGSDASAPDGASPDGGLAPTPQAYRVGCGCTASASSLTAALLALAAATLRRARRSDPARGGADSRGRSAAGASSRTG
jgi:hypothetical protein